MFTYEEAKNFVIDNLLLDAKLHDAGDYWSVGDKFDEYDAELPRDDDPRLKKLHIALNFWDGWQDSRNHDWHFYKGITKDDWPRLAQMIVMNIQEEQEITEEVILEHFDPKPREGMISKLRNVFKKNSNT